MMGSKFLRDFKSHHNRNRQNPKQSSSLPATSSCSNQPLTRRKQRICHLIRCQCFEGSLIRLLINHSTDLINELLEALLLESQVPLVLPRYDLRVDFLFFFVGDLTLLLLDLLPQLPNHLLPRQIWQPLHELLFLALQGPQLNRPLLHPLLPIPLPVPAGLDHPLPILLLEVALQNL